MQDSRPGLFLDRDGILNRVVIRGSIVSSPWSMEEFRLIEEALPLIDQARESGMIPVVITNQPDVARGNLSPAVLEGMHEKIRREFGVQHIEICMSSDDADPRRKPNPGMIFESAQALALDLARSWIVGDSRKDMEAGRRAGIGCILLETDYNGSAHGTGNFNCRSFDEILRVMRERILR